MGPDLELDALNHLNYHSAMTPFNCCYDYPVQGLVFFLAGFETSSTTLSLASYLLATNSEVQDRLIAEIDEIAPRAEDLTYEAITKLTYLDWFICETLRVYPPAVV